MRHTSERKMLAKYQASGLTPERCMELAEAERAGRLIIFPDLSEAVSAFMEALKRSTYGLHDENENRGDGRD